ncbi:MAG: class I adenylate-forming enzyme family protein [Isosphaeraceae bacterium]
MIDPGQASLAGQPGHFLAELRATFAARAGRPAIHYKDASWTYGDLDAKARRCAGRLQQLGVEPGDRVAVITPEKLPFLAAHLGTLYSGAISLPLNPRFTADELRYFLQDSGARAVVAGEAEQPVIESLRSELPELRAILSDDEAWDAPETTFSDPVIDREAACLMMYSSGTTGRPKGVVHNHANLASSLRALQSCWRFTPDDVLVNVLPLFHIHGLSFATHLSLLTGCCMHVEDTFHPRRTLEVVERGTVFMAIPTFYYTFLDRPEFRTVAQRWRDVRLFTCGSAPIRPEVLPELESILGRPVINRYGMTEAHVITSLPIDGPWPQGSVGLPLDGIEVRVLDDDGAPAAPDQVGSVQLRGPNLFSAYWRRPDATREAFASGWFDTGDLGFRDTTGFLTLVARKHDLIICNGFNVYPQVVERVINECPGVRESAVVGIPDRKRGERVVAVVVRADETLTDHAIRAYLGDRLVDYQRPADIVFVPALPRNAMGKVLRRELRDQLNGG